jgi:hypothetical protein
MTSRDGQTIFMNFTLDLNSRNAVDCSSGSYAMSVTDFPGEKVKAHPKQPKSLPEIKRHIF